MKLKKVFLTAALGIGALGSTGCTDAMRGKISSYGSSATVKCYSGEKLIYDGESTGKVVSEEKSDGYFFRDKETGQNVEVSGNCIIAYKP